MNNLLFDQLSFCFGEENPDAAAVLSVAIEEARPYLRAEPPGAIPIDVTIDKPDLAEAPVAQDWERAEDPATRKTKKKKTIPLATMKQASTAEPDVSRPANPKRSAGRPRKSKAIAEHVVAPPAPSVASSAVSADVADIRVAFSGDLPSCDPGETAVSPSEDSAALPAPESYAALVVVEPDEVLSEIEPVDQDSIYDDSAHEEIGYVAERSTPDIDERSGLRDVVRVAARAYSDERADAGFGDSTSDPEEGDWDWLLDERGRLVSPGRSGDTLADFVITSIANVWDDAAGAGNTPEKAITAIGQELHRAADILARCVDRIDALRDPDGDAEGDRPIFLREIVQAAAAGYCKAGKNVWNQLINEDGYFEAEADFEDLLAAFVIREIGFGYSSSEPAATTIDNAIAGLSSAQARLRRVACAIAWSQELAFCY